MDRPITVAVVDGNAGTREELIRRLGREAGVVVVGDAAAAGPALAMVAARRPDVVVMDARGLEPRGAALVGRMAGAAGDGGVVVLTAYVTARERADLVEAGARAVVLKEIDSGALVRAIRAVAEGVAGEPGPDRATLGFPRTGEGP